MAVANYIFPNSLFRKITVIATAVVLIISAGWLHFHVGLNPQVMAYPQFDRVILALDLAILAYITFVAVQRRHVMLLALAVLQIVSLGYLEFFIKPNMSIVPSIVIDRLSVVMYLVISVVGSIIAVYALKYMEEHEEHIENKGRNGRFFLWFIAFLGIMNGLVFSNNLFWFYFFWEATTLCSFQLIGHDNSEEARNNAMRALFYNSIGGLALIAGLAMLIRYFGPAAGSLMSVVNSSLGVSSTVFVGGLALFALAGFTKAAQFPFQSWLLGAMVAPTPVSALLHSSTMVKAGVYLI
ncbi:MAG: proton-conducting transporter membrane subunit, partial [Acidobacteriota bacterium]